MGELGRKGIIATATTVAFFLVVEGAMRLAGIVPEAWPSADGMKLPQIRIDPLLGPLPQPGYAGNWFSFPVEIDAGGFRSTGLPPPSNPQARVAFVGDSCTFGWGLSTADTFVAQLDAIQRARGEGHLALRNAGYPGQSAVVGKYMVRERVLPWDPDVVVIGFSGNNAFRFSVVSDADRFRLFRLRKMFLHSRVFHVLAAKLANRRPRPGHPRDRRKIVAAPLERLYRVASEDDYETAIRAMVDDSRRHGAEPLILLFPRASQVSTDFWFEDAALLESKKQPAERDPSRELGSGELGLLEYSCLDHRALEEPVETLRAQIGKWKPVYPSDPTTRGMLKRGAQAYVAGDLPRATDLFSQAVSRTPDSPLARYDLGVARLAAGSTAAGLSEIEEADRLACNVFLSYQVLVRHIAEELDLRVVDLMLHFQTRDGEHLFLDPAHPNAEGSALIAQALWTALSGD